MKLGYHQRGLNSLNHEKYPFEQERSNNLYFESHGDGQNCRSYVVNLIVAEL